MENHNYFVVIPTYILLDKNLSDKQKLLVGFITNLSNVKGYCFASNKYLAECLCCSEKTVSHLISDLEEKGHLGRVIKLRADNSVEFRTLMVLPPPLKNEDTPPQISGYPSPQNREHNNKVVNNKEEYNITSFEIFWETYAYKKDTARCKKKWYSMTEFERQQTMKVLPSYIKQTPNLKYRKHPLTWLNGKCWIDESETTNVKPIYKSLGSKW